MRSSLAAVTTAFFSAVTFAPPVTFARVSLSILLTATEPEAAAPLPVPAMPMPMLRRSKSLLASVRTFAACIVPPLMTASVSALRRLTATPAPIAAPSDDPEPTMARVRAVSLPSACTVTSSAGLSACSDSMSAATTSAVVFCWTSATAAAPANATLPPEPATLSATVFSVPLFLAFTSTMPPSARPIFAPLMRAVFCCPSRALKATEAPTAPPCVEAETPPTAAS